MDSKEQASKKRKKGELFKTIVINVVVWLIIITFVTTIGVYSGDAVKDDSIKLVEVNGKSYKYGNYTSYSYIFNGVRDNMQKNASVPLTSEQLNSYALTRSLETLINYAMMKDYAEKVGIKPSKEYLRSIIAYFIGNRADIAPPEGLVEYVSMEYANTALSGENGDILNVISPMTIAELYSYFDLVNFSIDADILYIDMTNYISEKVTTDEITEFYNQHITAYGDELIISEISLSNEALGMEIVSNLGSLSWEEVVAKYQGTVSYKEKFNIKKGNIEFSTRYAVVSTNKVGAIIPMVYESGEYHIIKYYGYPTLDNLQKNIRDMVLDDYVRLNFTNLSAKFQSEMESRIQSAADMVSQGKDFKSIALASGVKYVKTGKTAPVNQILRDDKGAVLSLPLLQNDDWFDFAFGSEIGSISPVLKSDSHLGIMKITYKGLNPNMNYENIDREIAMRYANYKSISATRDWYENLKSFSVYKIFEEEIKKLEDSFKRD